MINNQYKQFITLQQSISNEADIIKTRGSQMFNISTAKHPFNQLPSRNQFKINNNQNSLGGSSKTGLSLVGSLPAPQLLMVQKFREHQNQRNSTNINHNQQKDIIETSNLGGANNLSVINCNNNNNRQALNDTIEQVQLKSNQYKQNRSVIGGLEDNLFFNPINPQRKFDLIAESFSFDSRKAQSPANIQNKKINPEYQNQQSLLKSVLVSQQHLQSKNLNNLKKENGNLLKFQLTADNPIIFQPPQKPDFSQFKIKQLQTITTYCKWVQQFNRQKFVSYQ
eukprot:403367996